MTNNSTFLSIIIPVYRVEAYLRECLDCIGCSPLDCWEAILIDDGSPDGCPAICDEYAAKDSRFHVIHQKNAGVAAARNAGLDVARGEWAWFVDSDDVVDMRPVGKIVEWLQKHREVDLVLFDLDTFKDGEVVTSHQEENENALRVQDEQLSKNDFLMKHICYHHQRPRCRSVERRKGNTQSLLIDMEHIDSPTWGTPIHRRGAHRLGGIGTREWEVLPEQISRLFASPVASVWLRIWSFNTSTSRYVTVP